MTRAMLVAALLAACTDEITVVPVIDVPDNDMDAEAFAVIDAIEISIASEGNEGDIIKRRFARGADLEVTGIAFGSNLVMHLTGVTGSTQVGYGRTCAFSVTPGAELIEPHVFFSSSRKFATTNIPTANRQGGQAISYLGSAMVLGGDAQSIEQFDPRTGELTTALDSIAQRTGAVGALLGISPPRIALVGGADGPNAARVVELFDPREGLDTIDDARMGRIGLTATSLADGRVIVIGGNAPNLAPVGTITELEPAGTSADIRDVDGVVLAHPRTGHTATRLGDDLGAPVLIAGGSDGTTTVPNGELFRPLSRTLSPMFAPPMKHARTRHHAARMPDGSVLFIGGVDAAGNPVRDLERFTIDEGFIDVVNASGGSVALDPTIGVTGMTVTQLPDGRLLVAGGHPDGNDAGAPTNVAFVLRLDPNTGTLDVLPTDKLAVARANHQAALLCDGTVFLSGGADGVAAERYNPPPTGRR